MCSAMMNRDRAAHPTPHFGSVLPRGDTSDVDAGSALAPDHVLHGAGEAEGLHQVNASIPCDEGLKHHETFAGGEAFDFGHVCVGGLASGLLHQRFQLCGPPFDRAALNDGPTSQQTESVGYEEVEEIGQMFKTVVWQVHKNHMGLS